MQCSPGNYLVCIEQSIYNLYVQGKCKCGQNVRSEGQRRCKACHARAMREFRAVHEPTPEQRQRSNVRSYLHVYVKRGKVKKQPCLVCGCPEVEAHHDDYNQPLKVVWLCRPHHVQLTCFQKDFGHVYCLTAA